MKEITLTKWLQSLSLTLIYIELPRVAKELEFVRKKKRPKNVDLVVSNLLRDSLELVLSSLSIDTKSNSKKKLKIQLHLQLYVTEEITRLMPNI